jgi:hypothetical protein
VYYVSQLWSALLNQRNEEQWLYFLEMLSNPKYDRSGAVKKAHQD